MAKNFDVVVIGAGPGGYIAAIRAAQLGLSTACIDEWKTSDGKPAPGGTCTNVGCIPSKALLQSSENFEHAGHAFAEHGIQVKGLSIDVGTMLKRKDKVVKQNNDGILYLFKKNKVTFFHGRGSFKGSDENGYQVAVAGAKEETITARHVIVATGSLIPFELYEIARKPSLIRVGIFLVNVAIVIYLIVTLRKDRRERLRESAESS